MKALKLWNLERTLKKMKKTAVKHMVFEKKQETNISYLPSAPMFVAMLVFSICYDHCNFYVHGPTGQPIY